MNSYILGITVGTALLRWDDRTPWANVDTINNWKTTDISENSFLCGRKGTGGSKSCREE